MFRLRRLKAGGAKQPKTRVFTGVSPAARLKAGGAERSKRILFISVAPAAELFHKAGRGKLPRICYTFGQVAWLTGAGGGRRSGRGQRGGRSGRGGRGKLYRICYTFGQVARPAAT